MSPIFVVDNASTYRKVLVELASSLDDQSSVIELDSVAAVIDSAADAVPDLIIVNFNPPDLDAADLVLKARGLDQSYDIPIMVVTGHDERRLRYLALEAGASDFMLLPVDHVEFRARCRNLLARRRQLQFLRGGLAAMEQRLVLSDRLRKKQLSESEEKLRLVTDAVPAMICASDSAGRCVTMNSYQGQVFAVDPESGAGKTLVELFGADYGTRHSELDREVFSSGREVAGLEEILTDPDGLQRVFLTTKSPLHDFAGEVVNVVTISIDITERKESERAQDEAKELAEYANRTKTEFLANMSHELRTPLNAIIGFADIMKVELLGPVGNPKYREYANDILESARHLLNLMNDMLDVSKIESGQIQLRESEVDMMHVIDDVIRLMSGRAKEAKVEVEASILSDLPLIRADDLRVKQVLLNLVSNGIKFTPVGGQVQISAAMTDNKALSLQVSDSGIGISDEDLPTVVARFGRVDNAINARSAGAGLGLPLAIDLIELHGGTLDISSGPEGGTTMTVLFPPERTLVHKNKA